MGLSRFATKCLAANANLVQRYNPQRYAAIKRGMVKATNRLVQRGALWEKRYCLPLLFLFFIASLAITGPGTKPALADLAGGLLG
ncbi:hypothetical protein FHS90_000216 [Rufibacter quisquiliarum]|uniref:Uncharacterized protein n=1 Tax=Rufibacter quisquiliarum TaxID=1549639 RepID=A0A839GFS3_9BACT|nr:hypothetical protein [Rufibacter quisquiliarum]